MIQLFLDDETAIHKDCIRYLVLQYPHALFHHSPNQGKRSYAYANWLKSLEMKKGFPDIVIFEPRKEFHGLIIELKTETGKVSKEQNALLEAFVKRGFSVWICRSFGDFKRTVDEYLR